MKKILWDSARRVQDIDAKETAAPLPGAAEKQIRNLLSSATGQATAASSTEKFSSREVTILLTDLRGFTSVSKAYPLGVVEHFVQLLIQGSDSN